MTASFLRKSQLWTFCSSAVSTKASLWWSSDGLLIRPVALVLHHISYLQETFALENSCTGKLYISVYISISIFLTMNEENCLNILTSDFIKSESYRNPSPYSSDLSVNNCFHWYLLADVIVHWDQNDIFQHYNICTFYSDVLHSKMGCYECT